MSSAAEADAAAPGFRIAGRAAALTGVVHGLEWGYRGFLRLRRLWRKDVLPARGRATAADADSAAPVDQGSSQRAAAASSLARASTQRSPAGVSSFFQNGACVFR